MELMIDTAGVIKNQRLDRPAQGKRKYYRSGEGTYQ